MEIQIPYCKCCTKKPAQRRFGFVFCSSVCGLKYAIATAVRVSMPCPCCGQWNDFSDIIVDGWDRECPQCHGVYRSISSAGDLRGNSAQQLADVFTYAMKNARAERRHKSNARASKRMAKRRAKRAVTAHAGCVKVFRGKCAAKARG